MMTADNREWGETHGGFGEADDPRTWEECEPRDTDAEWPDDEARECFHGRE
jgi:hypothetical protein